MNLLKNITFAASTALLAQSATAEMVTLGELGGSISVYGELLSYDGETYTIRTSLGDLTLEASRSICKGDGCPDLSAETTNLLIAGSGTVTGHLIPTLAQAYFGQISNDVVRDDEIGGRTYLEIARENQPDLLITLVHSNSAMGVAKLTDGGLHAAFTTRPATDIERVLADEAGLGELRSEELESVVAYDSLLVVTHPSNPIQAMSEMDMAEIFAGQITDWGTFGGKAGTINVYMREADSNSRELLEQVLLAPQRKTLAANVVVLKSDAEIAEAVRNDPNAFGLTSFAHRAGTHALEIEGVCGIRVPATQFTIKTGEYPLARPVYYYHNANVPHDGLRGFSAFMKSQDAQSIIAEAGFVDRQILAEPLNMQGLRVTHAIMGEGAEGNMAGTRDMLKLMSYSDRLSTTIRFEGGSTDLDATDYQDLEALADVIRSNTYDGASFYFMGFSDSVGRADLNQFVALQRAEIVRQALVSRYPELANRIEAKSVGYGELSPLACNETRPGRRVNRRVEVWVQKPMAMASR